jgi:hypothetical protein
MLITRCMGRCIRGACEPLRTYWGAYCTNIDSGSGMVLKKGLEVFKCCFSCLVLGGSWSCDTGQEKLRLLARTLASPIFLADKIDDVVDEGCLIS